MFHFRFTSHKLKQNLHNQLKKNERGVLRYYAICWYPHLVINPCKAYKSLNEQYVYQLINQISAMTSAWLDSCSLVYLFVASNNSIPLNDNYHNNQQPTTTTSSNYHNNSKKNNKKNKKKNNKKNKKTKKKTKKKKKKKKKKNEHARKWTCSISCPKKRHAWASRSCGL